MEDNMNNKQGVNDTMPQSKISEGNTNALRTSDAISDHNAKLSLRDETIAEIEELDRGIRETEMPKELGERALRSIDRLRRMAKRGSYSGEFETVEKYLYWITGVPWGRYSEDNLDIDRAKKLMDSTHHGIDTVKDLVLDYLAVMQLQSQKEGQFPRDGRENEGGVAFYGTASANAPVLLFVGLQGVGKTTIARSIANSMGRKYSRISIGAMGGVQALRGQSRAFLDAEPGQIVKSLIRCGTMNPVIVLDEIDKASGNSGLLNDIMAALLEILDPEQNSTFVDHYLDYPVDLSKIFFICTANSLGTLSAALLDRLEVIRFTSYSDEEKEKIAKSYTMPDVLKNSGLNPGDIIIQEDVWPLLIRPVGFDAGLRQLERSLATLARRVVRKTIEGKSLPITITRENLREYVLPDQGPLS
jgi:ATP-dependent Lon protease